MTAMKSRTLGASGPVVSAIGLGCMGMSDLYGAADRADSLATIEAALAADVTLLDTGDFYGMGHNELLLAEALRQQPRDAYQLSVKFGVRRAPDGQIVGIDTRPTLVKDSLAYSLRRLGVDEIDVYRPARLDPAVPIEETVGAIAEMVDAGFVRAIGLSEVGVETLGRAQAVHPICDLQIEYSLFSRGIEEEILPACRDLGVGVTAYGVLSRGLLSGHWSAERGSGADFRATVPRFQGSNLEHNLGLVERLRTVAEGAGLSVAQLAIAWVLDRGADVVPLVGARRPERLAESLGAVDVRLDDGLRAAIDAAVPAAAVAGSRYNDAGMATLDSERPGT